ncbi:hypothetical protein [Comamonas koreensis]|uniref:Ig-like domain-containing protein n=1 Tax=Comamonas koreensis TaxID=160825 RepID=A0AAW4XW80_9BURK|nr:hypothetical protein [Comamonas koreensis]MCD2165800.1 hypothetical protein [Comamonas koreensis]
MNPIRAQRTLRRLLYGGLASLALVCSFNALAASTGAGRAYGLQVTADVPGVGLGVPIADTGQKTAPPDFNTPVSVLNASVAAGVGNLLTVRTGVLNAATQSKLAQNSVVSSSSVNGLALKLAGLALGADTVSSQAKMSCVNGTLTPEGSAQILGASGSLVGVSVAANTRVDLTIGVPTFGTMVGVILHTNEQTLSPDGKTFSVNALRVELVASAVGIRLLGASVIVGNSSVTMADCAPTVTLGSLPLITTSNQAAIPVSGSCSAGSGNVTISSTPTGVAQSLPCSATGSYSGSVNTTALADGPVTLTASQPPAGPARSASQSTTKNTAPVLQPPVVTVVSAPHITAANQASYSVSGTCSANGAAVSILVGAVPASAQCSGGLWSASGLNVTAVPNGSVTVTASQTVSGLVGTATFTTSKDAAGVLPVVVVTSAPAITAANQASYTVSGSCSVNGTNVSVVIDTVSDSVPCSGNIWAAAGLDVTALPNGPVTVTASQTVGSQTGSGSLGTTKDAAGAIPVVTIGLAPAITQANQAGYTVSGTCSVNGNNVAVLVGSVAASALCTNGSWSTAGLDVSALPNGAVTVMASQTVGAQTGSATLVTSKDVTGAVPVVAVTSAPTITPANQASYTVSGSCSVNSTDVAVLIGSIAATATCNGGLWSSAGLDVSSLLDGSVTVTASQTVGNQTGSGSLLTTKNTVVDAPVVTITSAPAITALNVASYTVSGTCSANGTNVAVLVGSVAASAACTGSIWSSSGMDVSGLADGPVLVTASQTVSAQTGSGSLVTAKDTAGIAPVVSISSAPAITATNQSAYTVSGTCSVIDTNVAVLIGSIPASAMCNAGLWTTSAVNVGTLPDGAVTVTASQTADGRTGSGTLVISKDTAGVAPAVVVTSAPPITIANQASYIVSGTCSANGSTVSVLVGSVAASALCDSSAWATAGLDVSSLPDGPVTITASQTVNAQTGSGSLVTSKTAVGIAPVVTITSAPLITAANQSAYTVSGTCSANGSGVGVLIGSVAASAQCSGGIWATAGVDVSGLANGPVSVVASQTVGDLTGSGSLVIVKDSQGIAPVVTITSAPAITAANQTAYTVSGTCSENGVVLMVHVGDVVAVPQPVCSGGIWSTAALDVSGLPDETVLVTASQTVGTQTGTGSLVTTKDTAGVAPVVVITSAPAIAADNQLAYSVSGTCTVNGTDVAVLVGSVAASAPCSGGLWATAALDVSGLADGSVTVTASQTAGSLTGSGSLVTSKSVAVAVPSVAITSAPAITAANQAAYVVSGSCSVNGADVSVLVGQVAATAPCSSGTWITAGMDVSGLPAGAVTVMASQTAGSQTGSVSLVINKEPAGIVPVVAITLPPDITVSNQAAYTVSGTCSVAGTNVAVQVGSIAASVACDGSSWTTAPLDVSGLPDGLVTVTASQTVSGGSGSASVVVNKTAAATAPVVTIGLAPAITLANQASYTVSGTCSASGTSVAVQVGSVPASATCDAGAWTASGLNVSALPDGVVVVTAEQIVGGLSGSDSVETTKATAAIVPVVVITSAPAITALNEAAYTVSGTCSVNGEVVTVLVGSIPASATCSDGIWATEPTNVSGLADGQITVQASQDAGGQTGTVSLVISKDSAGAAPAVGVISAPPITAANQSAYTVSGTCSANGAAVAVQIGSVPASAQCNAGIWSSTAVDVSALPDGPVTVTVSQTLGTQTGTGSLVTTKDATGIVPVVSVTSAPAITLANQAAYTVSGSCSVDGSNVAVLVGSVSASAVCNAGIWSSAAVDVTALPDGAVTVMASQTASGQTGSGSLVTSKETAGAAPVVTVSSAPAITAANQASYTVSGSCSADGIPVAVQVGSVAASAPCAAGNWSAAGLDVTGLADGPVTVTAAQTVGSVLGSGSLVTLKDTAGVVPVVTVTSAPAITAANQGSYVVSGSCSVNNTTVAVQIGSVSSSAPCAGNLWTIPAVDVSGLPDGSVTVTAAQTVGALQGSGSLVTNKSTGGVQPVVTITSAADITAANQSAYSVSGTCSVNGTNVDVLVGSVSASVPCTSGSWMTAALNVSGLQDGTVTVTAQQTVGALVGSANVQVNKGTGVATPVVTITSAPAITAANASAYSVSGTCSVNGSNVDVQVGSVSATAPCMGGLWATEGMDVSGLADGPVAVTATQVAGGQTGTGSFATSKDTAGVAPVVAITSAPVITAANQSAYSVSGNCSADGAAVTVLIGSIPASAQCNAGIWASSGVDVSGLPDGAVTIMASQTAGAQTGSGSLVTTKDSAGASPAVAITSAPAITAANQSAYTVSGTCSADGGNVAVLVGSVSASAVCTGGIWASPAMDVSGLADGPVSVSVSLTAGGQTGTGGFVTSKDAAGAIPAVAITSAPAITAANQASYTVSGTCSVGGTNVTVLVGSISATAVCSGGTWSVTGLDVSGLPNGPVTVTVAQTAGGQTGSGGFVTSKDAAGVVPAVAVTSAPAITAANQTAYTVSGTCSVDGANVTVLVGSISVTALCSGGTWSTPGLDVSGLPDGAVTVTVAQTAGGQTGTGGFVTSKSAGGGTPVFAITSAPAISLSNQASYTVSGTCAASGSNVTVVVGSLSVSVPCNGGTWSTAGLDVRGLPDGAVMVTASQTVDGAVVSSSQNAVKDTVAPVVSIGMAPSIDTSNQGAYSPAGGCTSGDGTMTVKVGTVQASAACINGSWTAPGMDVRGLPDGAVAVTASQTDQAGNTGSITREVSKSTGSGGEPPEPPVARIAPQNGTWIISDELNGEPGRGMGIDIQDGVLFMQVYNYRQSGEATFHTALGTLRDNKVTAPLYFYEGGRYFGSEQRDGHAAGSPGNVVITFTSRSTGTIQFPGEPVKAMHRFDYEGTPAGVFSDPAFVDRWAMVELNSSNQPVRSWWADIGTSEQVSMSEDWAAAAMGWPYPPTVATAVHGFGGTLSGHLVAQCSYGGRGLVFNCSGNRAGANGAPVIAMTMQRGVDQLSGTVKEGGGDTRRLVGFRVARAAYAWQDNQSVRTSYYAPGYLPESGTWVVSSELRGLPGRGISIELQKPLNQEDHLLFMSVYDYQSDGKATFHSVLGAHDASTTPEPNTPDLPTVQYQGGRYFGGPAASARFKADAGPTQSIHFSAPSVGTLAFPGEEPVQIERFYYSLNKGSAQSLRGSWSVLSATDAMPSRIFRFQKRDENSVIDTDSGYVCVAEVLRQYNFRCTGPAGAPAFRFVAGFYGASSGIVGDAEDAPAITVMRVTDPNGEMVQAGD